MAEREAFKFPDETDADDKKVEDKVDFEIEGDDAGETKVEVADDTPPQDRGPRILPRMN